MKNWYKISQNRIEDFKDRNRFNAQIKKLEEIYKIILKASKIVDQTQRGAKKMINDILHDKTLSSYPNMIALLQKAEKVAMDSPKSFTVYCNNVLPVIDKEIKKLMKERREFVEESGKKLEDKE